MRPGDLIVVSGVGGLGHLTVQYAKIFDGTVAAVDIADEKLQLAAELGADIVIDARAEVLHGAPRYQPVAGTIAMGPRPWLSSACSIPPMAGWEPGASCLPITTRSARAE